MGILVWDVRLRVREMDTMREVFEIQAKVLNGAKMDEAEWVMLQHRWDSFSENP